MNVMLISQCDKKALTESRRILDQFAERRGDRTWQTSITQDGLITLRSMLRKTARKNTAVACHWIRGVDRSELIWRVGDVSRFNAQGAVPTNTTTRNILREHDQNDWQSGELIQLLTDLAGLLHDLGKAMRAFQMRLEDKLEGRNLLRHEWVSLRLFEAFVGQDNDITWLGRLCDPTAADKGTWLSRLHRDCLDDHCISPFKSLTNAPLAKAVGWLVMTHHRLPVLPFDQANMFHINLLEGALNRLEPSWNESEIRNASRETIEPYWDFPHGLPVSTPEWQHRASRVAKRLQHYAGQPSSVDLMNNPFVLHLSRLCLMLADHHYSRLELGTNGKPNIERVKIAFPSKCFANTRDGNQKNQPLDEHLVGVAKHGAEVARFLPRFERHLPRLGKHRLLKQRSSSEQFRWQNKAADLAVSVRVRSEKQGVFIVNMASTGCGKTLANARIMYALADPLLGMRCAFAMGLRVLTLQTGKAFRDLLGLDDEDLAIRVGGSASRSLFEHFEAEAEATGSASRQDLLDEDVHIVFEGQQDTHPLLRRAVVDPATRNLITAPVLVCTIDHLTPSTESQRGGRQIAPMLRLMSGDLVLDEPDDFDLSDLPALTRLVHWAGLLGARVLLSSATLPPSLIQGLFEAYQNGRSHFQRNLSEQSVGAQATASICCLWVDEFKQKHADCMDAKSFEHEHLVFAQTRVVALIKQSSEPRRRVTLVPLEGLPRSGLEAAKSFSKAVFDSATVLHQAHHSIDRKTGKRVSFGLVRMANIDPLHDVALALFEQGVPEGQRVHLCVYHSRFPLLIRSAIERQLDATLKRHLPEGVFDLPTIRERLDNNSEPDQIFIVLGSPVTEVGRDHDYDWAVVEPSSMRSLIQLCGRVRRHRVGDCGTTNVHVFTTNLRNFRKPGEAAFCKPGFEQNNGPFRLANHDLRLLLTHDDYATIDAHPRILEPVGNLQPQHRLVDLEHARMRNTMLPQINTPLTGWRARALVAEQPILNASTWWKTATDNPSLTGLIQQQQVFRENTVVKEVELVLLPDQEGEQAILHRLMDQRVGRRLVRRYIEVEHSEHTALSDNLVQGERIQLWGVTDYMKELHDLAESLEMPLRLCAERFGSISVYESENGWKSHAALGFVGRDGL